MRTWNIIFLVFGVWIEQTSAVLRGRCAECLPNSVACVDEESFRTCWNGKMSSHITRCPENKVCTAEQFICLPRSTGEPDSVGYSPVCYDDCEPCSSTYGNFACVSETDYGFCYDKSCVDLSSVRSCPNGHVCSLESPEICVTSDSTSTVGDENILTTSAASSSEKTTESETTEEDPETETQTFPATKTATEATSSPRTPTDPDVFCAAKKGTGYFKDPDDMTCKGFFYCYLLSGQYLGIRYYCAGFFDATTNRCEANKPSRCY